MFYIVTDFRTAPQAPPPYSGGSRRTAPDPPIEGLSPPHPPRMDLVGSGRGGNPPEFMYMGKITGPYMSNIVTGTGNVT